MKYSLLFRLWHWMNAFVVMGLLATVLLRKTFLSWRTNSEILITKLDAMGIEITQQQGAILAKAVRAGMWEWHIILGYFLAFLVLYRIALYFFEKKEQERFASLSIHKKGVRISYYLLYVSLGFMALSGLTLNFEHEIGLGEDLEHTIKEIHEFMMWPIVVFVVAHIVGVVVAENRDEAGLISTMVNGVK